MTLFLVEENDQFNLHSQYHGCWYPGDTSRRSKRGNGFVLYFLDIFFQYKKG